MSTMTISDQRTDRAETWEKAEAFRDERRETAGVWFTYLADSIF